MAGTTKKWLIGCGAGCGVLVLLSILLSVGGVLFMTRPMDRAVQAQVALTAEFGPREEFVPPVRLEPERIEAFLAVRAEVMTTCAEFEKIAASFREMDQLDAGGQEPGFLEVMGGLRGVMGSVFGLAGAMGDATRLRNEALARQGMGLGEYTWIYVLAYNGYLGKAPNTGLDDEQGRGYGGEKRRLITRLMENHAGALEAAGMAETARVWRDEAARLQGVEEAVPFADGGLPAALADVFQSYRGRLEKSYCPALADFDLGDIEKKGLSYHAR